MQALVSIQDSKVVTTSRNVAEAFDKEHKNVLRDIANLDCSANFTQLNFEPSMYISELANNVKKENPEYLITRDGFTFLAMGYTGKRAAEFKEAYIYEFNQMEERLRNQQFLGNGGFTVEDLIIAQAQSLKDVKQTLKQLKEDVRDAGLYSHLRSLSEPEVKANKLGIEDKQLKMLITADLPTIPSLAPVLYSVTQFCEKFNKEASTGYKIQISLKAMAFCKQNNLNFYRGPGLNRYPKEAIEKGIVFMNGRLHQRKNRDIEFLKNNDLAQTLKMLEVGEYMIFSKKHAAELLSVISMINRSTDLDFTSKFRKTATASYKVTRNK
jgi:Rha family phage regulatory protein